jgi:hypothetical protein
MQIVYTISPPILQKPYKFRCSFTYQLTMVNHEKIREWQENALICTCKGQHE